MSGALTIEEAAVLVGVSGRTVRRWVALGLLVALPDSRGRAKLYPLRGVYEAEQAARLGRCPCAIVRSVS